MGTPDFAVPALQRLIAHYDVIGVVTQPDRPAGRSRKLQMSPVKQVALAADIPVFQPEKLRRPEAIEELKQWQPDFYVVAAFGQILPQAVLDIPPHGSINIHASLLPRWRGAAPIQAVIRAGDAETGITIMRMDAGLDTGPILSQRAIPLAPDETGQSLHDKLADLGGDLLIETLPGYLSGDLQPQPQDDSADDARAAHQERGRARRLDAARRADRADDPRLHALARHLRLLERSAVEAPRRARCRAVALSRGRLSPPAISPRLARAMACSSRIGFSLRGANRSCWSSSCAATRISLARTSSNRCPHK